MNEERKSLIGRYRLPLSIWLAAPFVVQVTLLVGLVGLISFHNGQRTVNEATARLWNEIGLRIDAHLKDFLATPHQINQVNALALRNGQMNLAEPAVLQQHYLTLIQAFPSITSAYLGNPQGGMVGAGREWADGAQYLTETRGFRPGTFHKYVVDQNGQAGKEVASVPNFDARERPWFTGAVEAGKPTWSPVYVLITGQDMAIAASQPVYDDASTLLGVTSVDVFLSHLSDFLSDIRVGKTGYSFIIERSGLLVAASNPDLALFELPVGGGKAVRLDARESEDPQVQQAARFLDEHYGGLENVQGEAQLEFSLNGKQQFMQVAPIRDEYGIDWLAVVVAPASDFMAHIEENNRLTLGLIILAWLVALLMGFVSARLLSRPLYRLSASAQALAGGQWTDPLPPHRVKEIDQLTAAFNEMSAQLKVTLHNLVREVEERKQAQKTLQESEQRFRILVEQMPVLVNAFDEQGQFSFWNRECERVSGYSAVEVICNPAADTWLYPDDEYRQLMYVEWARRGNRFVDWEFTLTAKDGNKKVISWTSLSDLYPVPGWSSWAIGVDVTAHRLAEREQNVLLEQVSERAQQVQGIMDTVPEGMLLLDTSGRIFNFNSMARQLLAELSGVGEKGDCLEWLGELPLAALLDPTAQGVWREIAWRGRFYEAVIHQMASPVQDGLWVMALRDVTEAREAQQQAQQQARLASVGQLAAGIAHDFNNILAVISLYAEITLDDGAVPPEARERVQIIIKQARRAADLVQQIVDFGRRSVMERRAVQLGQFLREQAAFLRRLLPETIDQELEIVQDATVYADPTRLQQALFNLAVNARDAMPGGGRLKIQLRAMEPEDAEKCKTCGEDLTGQWVVISICDSGVGIPTDVLPKIFDPFFTTKGPGKGTGLGLAQTYGIVKQHGGHIEAASEPGQGTTFNVFLPAALPASVGKEQTQRQAPIDAPPLPKYKWRVLVVEDEPAVRDALRLALEALHCQVVCVGNGQEGLSVLKEQPGGFDLTLSDVVMPVMGGIALLRALRAEGINLPVAFVSGHPMRDELDAVNNEDPFAWLVKPVQLDQLAQLLERLKPAGQMP